MPSNDELSIVVPRDYYGRILSGHYSLALKKCVAGYINNYLAFEGTGNPATLYIAAWRESEKKIWYEYVNKRFIKLLGCEGSEAADVFRKSILDRIVYKSLDADVDIQKEILSREELNEASRELREDVKKRGIIDAVYKISLKGERVIWLKDVAAVEIHEQDMICLSLGFLTVVTKEMRAEEERLKRERLQVTLQMAGAVCHELNQPLQGISGYSERLLMDFSEDNPVFPKIRKIFELTKKVGQITRKLMRITKYETMDYLQGVKIIDIDKSSEE